MLFTTIETLRVIAILCQPFIPAAASQLLDLLAVRADERDFAFATPEHRLFSGVALPAPTGIFPRYVEPEETGGKGDKTGGAKA